MVKVTPLGGAKEVGGSSTVVEAFGCRLLVDYGLRPSARKREDAFPDLALARYGGLDAVVVTHAHADHTGGLPLLYREFPDIPYFATHATVDLAYTILSDSASIMERDVETEPAYTQEDVDALRRAWVPVDMDETVPVVVRDDVRVMARFVRAGHILGAAMVALEFEDQRTGQIERVLFSGDVSLFDQPTILGTDVEAVRGFQPTVFVCEGTYGARDHGDIRAEEIRMVLQVARVLERGGKVLVPAFALGRAQNVALILRKAIEDPSEVRAFLDDPAWVMPKCTILIDGLCRTVCDQYEAFQDQLAPQWRPGQVSGRHVFRPDDGAIGMISGRKYREAAMQSDMPTCFISSSGMLVAGASVAYAQELAKSERNAIFLCGYQDEESPGRILSKMTRKRPGETYPVVRLGGEPVTIRCEVGQYNLSAHSDAAGIERLVEAVRAQTVALVHGEVGALNDLRARLQGFTRRNRIGSRIEIAEANGVIEATAAHTFADLAIPPVGGAPSRVMQRISSGRSLAGEWGFSPSRAWSNAAYLRPEKRDALRIEDVVRLDDPHGGASHDPLAEYEVDIARYSLQLADRIWEQVPVGRDTFYRPVSPEDAPTDEELSHARSQMNRELVGGRDLGRYWKRVDEIGVREKDVVLAVIGNPDDPRLVPAIVARREKAGYVALSTALPYGLLSPRQIAARAFRWPTPSDSISHLGQEDVVLLQQLTEAVSMLRLELMIERLPSEFATLASPSVRSKLKTVLAVTKDRKEDEAEYARRLAFGLLRDHGDEERLMGVSWEDLQEILELPRSLTQSVLDSMAELGLLQYTPDSVQGGVHIQWTLKMDMGVSAHPRTRQILDALGPAMENLLRGAVERAGDEIAARGIERGSTGVIWIGAPGKDTPARLAPAV